MIKALPLFVISFVTAHALASTPDRMPWCGQSKGSKVAKKEVRRDRHGKRLAVGHCLDGKLHGLLTQWYPSGVKHSEVRYRRGKLEGVSRSFTPKGRLRVEARYRAGQLHGKWTQWHEDGGKEIEGVYGVHGQKGCWRTWSAQGVLLSRTCFRRGRRHGEATRYHASGALHWRALFVAGRRHGPYARFFADGRPWEKGAFTRGRKSGRWTTWHENGRKATEGSWLRDEEHGEWTSWNKAGIKTSVTRYRRGRAVSSRRFFVEPLLHAYGLSVDAAQHRQLLLVESTEPRWTSSYGHLRRFAWQKATRSWKQVGRAVNVRFGKSGLGRGRGLAAPRVGPIKREGDGRSPAGVFALGTALGTSPQRARRGGWPWRRVDAGDRWVDDPKSRYYNTWQRLEGANSTRRWRSAERLAVYGLAIVVEHNTKPISPGAGSAIFLHSGDTREPSVGCTVMSERELQAILRWLRPSAHPLLVQLPSSGRGLN